VQHEVDVRTVVVSPRKVVEYSRGRAGLSRGCNWTALTAAGPQTGFDDAIVATLEDGSGPAGCQQIRQVCLFAPAVHNHGAIEQAGRWQEFCSLADECERVANRLRELTRVMDAGGRHALSIDATDESAAIEQYLERLGSENPELAGLVADLCAETLKQDRLRCSFRLGYHRLLATTAEALLEGHRHAGGYIEEQLSRLPDDPANALELFTPSSKAYQRLVRAHEFYQGVVEEGGFVAVSGELVGLKKGRRKVGVTLLRTRLAQEGLPGLPDGSVEDASLFDSQLAQAVKGFQKMHYLKETGRIDRTTMERLEISAEDKLHAVRKALAVYRRAVGPWESTFILVQAPHAFLEFYVDANFARYARAIIGRATTRKIRETGESEFPYRTRPLNSAITSIVINPEWNVPDSIAREEIEPRLEKDPAYLRKKGFSVFEYGGGKRRYIQQPGPDNALGKVKFKFENDYGCYLHDTQKKRLFRRRIRLLSHGCVRVKDAVKLALLLLANDGAATWDSLRLVLRSGEEKVYKLRTPVPVHIAYSTAAADSYGHIFFVPDYYELERERP